MRVKNKKLQWNVMIWDFNTKKIKLYNVLTETFIQELYAEYKKKKILSLKDLENFVQRYSNYYFHHRCECEIVVGDMFTEKEDLEKTDIYTQIMMNIQHIVNYVNKELCMNLD